jgi:hypothetical protein
MNGSACCRLIDAEAVSGRLIIKGRTLAGKPFRPSDWAQRLAGAAGSRHCDGRFRFNPLVQVALVDGISSVVIDGSLARTNPHLYRFLMKFGCLNELQLSE